MPIVSGTTLRIAFKKVSRIGESEEIGAFVLERILL